VPAILVDVGDEDPDAGLGELVRDRATDAAGRTGDDGDLVL